MYSHDVNSLSMQGDKCDHVRLWTNSQKTSVW
jgi:hypothetical protein